MKRDAKTAQSQDPRRLAKNPLQIHNVPKCSDCEDTVKRFVPERHRLRTCQDASKGLTRPGEQSSRASQSDLGIILYVRRHNMMAV
jgi:hypothetical protein